MKHFKIRYLLIAALFGISQASFATNGYWSHGYGPKSKSIAGACVAMAFGAMCTASNPGSLVNVGNRIEAGAALFLPRRGFNADNNASTVPPPNGPASIPSGNYESSNDFFLIPHFAYNRMINENLSLGVTIGGNGGMNTEYDKPVFVNFGNPMMPSSVASSPTGINLMQGFIGLPLSYKINAQHSIGIAPIIAIQSFEAKGLQPFTSFSVAPDAVTNRGRDMSYGGGIRIGWLGQITPELNIGASYQSKLWMSKFDKYKGLFAEQGSFDIPPNYDLGFSYKLTPAVTFAFDYQRIQFEDVKTLGNASDLIFMPGSTLLGTNDGLGFGWKNMDIYKFGVQWEYSPEWSFRAGFSYANDIVPESQALFNTLAPGVVTRHYTAGFTKKLDSKNEFSAAVMYAPKETVRGTNPNTGPQTGNIYMDQWEIEVGWAMRF